MVKWKRSGALMLCLGLLLILMVSSAFILTEADHDCCGEACPICAAVAVCGRLLCITGIAVTVALSVPALNGNGLFHMIREEAALFGSGTPVSWKVRLNN